VIGDVTANKEDDDARGNEEKTLDDEYAQSVNTGNEENKEHNHGHGMVIGGFVVVVIAGLALATHYRLTNARKHVHAQVPSNIAFEESEEEEEEVLENVRIDTIPSATNSSECTQQLKPIKPAMINTVPLSFSEKPMVHTGFGDMQPGSMMGDAQSSVTMGSISAMGSLTGDVTLGGMPIGGSFNPSEMHMLQH